MYAITLGVQDTKILQMKHVEKNMGNIETKSTSLSCNHTKIFMQA